MFVEITRGRSFKGLAQYCLFDVDRQGSERVSFVETRNLGTDNAQAAWRIMAAKHYLQDELKEKAGVGRGGAKDGKPVGHLLISWKKEEAEAQQLNHLVMKQTAYGALRAIGAAEHQAIIIGHTDTAHPHCHVIVNLIGDDGRLKKNWKEREKLSKFALKQEKAIHGEAIVKTREKNWLDREAGETPIPVKKKPRHLYELEKAAKKCEQTRQFAQRHKRQLTELAQAKEAQKERHKRHQQRLLAVHQQRNRRIVATTQQAVRRSKSDIRRTYDQSWRELLNEQEAERQSFERNERNLRGSLANAMRLIDWKQLLRRKKQPDQLRLSDAFHILTSEAARRERLEKQQKTEQDKLRSKQRQEEQAKEQTLLREQEARLRQQRKVYVGHASTMKQRQFKGHEHLKAKQQELTRERNDALKNFRDREQQLKLDRAKELRQESQQAIELANDNTSQETPQSADPLPNVFKPAPSFNDAADAPAAAPAKRIRRERKERQPRQPRTAAKQNHHEGQVIASGQIQQTAKPAGDIEPRVRDRSQDKEPCRPIDILPQDEKAEQIAKQINEFEKRMLKHLRELQRSRDEDRR